MKKASILIIVFLFIISTQGVFAQKTPQFENYKWGSNKKEILSIFRKKSIKPVVRSDDGQFKFEYKDKIFGTPCEILLRVHKKHGLYFLVIVWVCGIYHFYAVCVNFMAKRVNANLSPKDCEKYLKYIFLCT